MTEIPLHPELPADFTYSKAFDGLWDAYTGGLLSLTPSGSDIAQVILQLSSLLLAKNRAYGDSALQPVSVFSDPGLPISERIAIRMDDKLSRVSGRKADTEDPVFDLLGYLVLYRIAQAKEAGV